MVNLDDIVVVSPVSTVTNFVQTDLTYNRIDILIVGHVGKNICAQVDRLHSALCSELLETMLHYQHSLEK